MRKALCTILTAFLVCLLLVGVLSPAAVPARAEEAAASQVYGWNLVLADEIAVNFLVDISDTVSADAVMNVTDGYGTTAYPIAEAERNAAGQYLFTAHLAAAQLADAITLELVSNGQIVSTEQYKAVDYANTVLAGDYSTETKALVGAMLHYGAAAQTYFAYNTDNLANAGLTAGEVDMPQWTETAIVSGSVPGVQFYGASLVFDSRVAVRFYFKAQSLTNVSFGTYTPVEKNGMYYVEIPGINPQDYDKAVSLTVTDGSAEMTVSYSPVTYIARQFAKSSNEALRALVCSMYQYHLEACTYVDVYTNGVAAVGSQWYKSLQAAINAANGKTVTLLTDIVLEDTVTVPAGYTVELDLAGKMVSQEKACNAHYGMIVNNGDLTITGNGKISFTDVGTGDPAFGWGSYTLINKGNLVVENGIIENLSAQNQGSVVHMYCAIQQSAGTTTINGGAVSTPTYRSVRINSGALIINSGSFEGQVWLQPNQGNVTLNITGGTFAPCGVDGSSVFMTNVGENYTVSSASVTGGTFTTKIGCSDPAALAGSITGGTFTANAKENTNIALLGERFAFVENSDGTYSVVFVKADPTYELPAGLTATYGQTLADVALPEGFAWKDTSASVGDAGENTFTAVYTPADTDNYNIVEVTVTVAVAKADPTYELPTGLTATYGQTLADVALPEGFTWKDSKIVLNEAGDHKYTAIFKPNDTNNYNVLEVEITVTVKAPAESIKFEKVFKNTDKYLYRVGNSGAITLGTLFAKNEGAEIGAVSVTIEAVNGTAANGTYAANTSDWTQGKLTFSGTGVVKVTITDNNYCIPTELYLEVVDAVNATSATNASSNNVVLLQDVGFSSLTISGGYTLYGNGFTMTCSSDSYATDRNYSFVTLSNGTLDNVQIIVPNFSHAVLYDSNKKENGNPSYTDASGKVRYYNIRSAVLMEGNSQILNSYISGGRAAVYAVSGNLLIENSTIEGGAAANIHIESVQGLTLRDVTLIQEPKQATVNDTSKTVMGLSVIAMCDGEGYSTPITLEGTLTQYAWACEDYKQYVPDDGKSLVTTVLGKTEYLHDIKYADGMTRSSLNLGFLFMPGSVGAKDPVANRMIIDNRTDKASVPYDSIDVSGAAYVYSYKNSNGTSAAVTTKPTYSPNTQGAVRPAVSFTDANENRVFETTYDATNGWMSTLTVDVDAGVYDFSFGKLLVEKFGQNLDYTVTKNGVAVDTSKAVTLNDSSTAEYVLTVTDNLVYNASGELSGDTAKHTFVFKLLSTKTSLPAPTWEAKELSPEPIIVVDSKGGDWNCAVSVLNGLEVNYWSKAQGKQVTLALSSIKFSKNGEQNGSNNTLTITATDEYTLTITTTGFKTNDNGKPVVVGGVLYFTVSSSGNYVSTSTTSRTINVNYTFTDANNSEPLILKKAVTVNYSDYKEKQYKYSDFCKGTLAEASSCITPDTLITLADGSQVRVDSLTGNEELLVWNMVTGQLDSAPILFVDSDPEAEYEVVHLYFSDGTDVKVIYEHGFWDYDLNRYVYLDANAAQYIGHTFAKQNGASLTEVTLTDVVLETVYTSAWSPVTAEHLCYFVEGMLSMPGGVGGLFNIFEVNPETMTYDLVQMQQDMEVYGLFTYEELAAYAPVLTEKMFIECGGAYLKISIGKGNMTMDELIAMINLYSKFF